ncbi:MAG: substrate-binding domain-containing protein [Succinivibrionaceae bacterium]|nr:substrate-binding domain-containing protein [Succinivibrionaceae bacterium]
MGRALGMVAALALAGLAGTAQARAPGQAVDAFYYDLSDPFVRDLADALEAQARRAGVELIPHDAAGDAGQQDLQISAALGNGHPKLLNLVYPRGQERVIAECRREGERLVFFNRRPSVAMTHGYGRAWFVEGDSMQAGQLQAKAIDGWLRARPGADRDGDGTLRAVVLRGDPKHQATYLRTYNVLYTLSELGHPVECVATLMGGFSEQQARTEFADYALRQGLDSLDLVICNNDAMALGVLAELQRHGLNLGKGGPAVGLFGIDGTEEALRALNSGMMSGTVCNDALQQAEVALLVATSAAEDRDSLSRELGMPISDTHEISVPYKMVGGQP